MGLGLDECAAAARSRGFPVFALQGYGQCFFGSMTDVARLQASQQLSDDVCSSLPCPASAATCPGYINKVYILIGARMPWGFYHGYSFSTVLSLLRAVTVALELVQQLYSIVWSG
jgi:hypothetical protein